MVTDGICSMSMVDTSHKGAVLVTKSDVKATFETPDDPRPDTSYYYVIVLN